MREHRLRHSRFRYLLEYAGMRIGWTIAAALPDDARGRLGIALGRVWHRFSTRRRNRALANLRIAYGDELDDARLEALARASFEHMGLLAAETVALWSPHWRSRLVDELVEFEDPHGVLDRLARADRPVVWSSCHLGNWEIGAMLLATKLAERGASLVAIVNPPENPWIRRDLERVRGKGSGTAVIPRWGAARRAVEAGRHGTHVALLSDDDAKEKGVFVPFFGRLTSSLPAAAIYALRIGAPIVTGYLVRKGLSMRFRYVLEEPIEPRSDARPPREVERITVEIQRRIEAAVRRDPEQFRWFYDRWKRKPLATSRIARGVDADAVRA